MSYNLNQYANDLQYFSSQFNTAYQESYDTFMNELSDMENISNEDISVFFDIFYNDVKLQIDNSISDVINNQQASGDEAATSLWSDIKDSVSNAWQSMYKEMCPICQGEMLPPEKIAYIADQCKDLTAFALIPKVSPTNAIEIIGANTLPGWDYGDDPSQRAWYDTWWDFYKTREFLKNLWKSAINYIVPADPLMLDLDGDGIETIAVSAANAVMYDYNGNEIKTNTGWSSPDDGFLVFDRDNNGIIDDASELFSDYTLLYAGGRAADGFSALAQEDTNKDGIVNNLDANWNNLKIWQDINSDGISQSEELFTMEEAGISGLNVAKSNINQNFPNGNSIKGTGTYIKNDGTTGLMGDVYFAVDTFKQQFTDTIPLLPEVEGLPNMLGSGLVRDLQQAASLSPQLCNLLTQYSEAATRQEQMAIIDQLLYAWANTSGMAPTLESRDPEDYRIQYDAFGSITRSANIVTGDGGFAGGGTGSGFVEYVPDVENLRLTESYRQLIAQWSQKLHILEAFNGSYFFAFPDQASAEGKGARTGMIVRSTSSTAIALGAPTKTLLINFRQAQLNLLNQSYELLRQSVYQALFYQTRFQTDFLPLLDNVELVFNEAGQLAWDYSGLEQHFADTITADPAAGMSDLLEFNRYVANYFLAPDWKGNEIFADYCRTLPVTPELQALYNSFGNYLHILPEKKTSYNASSLSGEEIIAPLNTGASISGSSGDDILIGSTANDRLFGGGGDDYLSGYAGDDLLNGMEGNDTLKGGAGNDRLYDNTGNDIMFGGAGNDTLYGREDNDVLFGDEGHDELYGGTGDDILFGGDGNDELYGEAGDDTLDGGSGNDYLYGGNLLYRGQSKGNDTYAFGRGSGQDSIFDYDSTPGNVDTILLKSDVSPNDVTLRREGYFDELVLIINGTTDTLEIYKWFDASGYYTVETIQFADGTLWDVETIKQMVLRGTPGNDTLIGYSSDDVIRGLAGNDKLYGRSGDDTLEGGSGYDSLFGEAGNDLLLGGDDIDYLSGGEGDDTLDGGTGDDYLFGGNSSYYNSRYGWEGWQHYDIQGNDTYLFGYGSGQDTIADYDRTPGNIDTILLKEGISPSDVTLRRIRESLVLSLNGSSDSITVMEWFTDESGAYQVEHIQFADGTLWDAEIIKQMIFLGTPGDDMLIGYSSNDIIRGLAGNDKLYGRAGDDTIEGGSGNDSLYGEAGNDTYLFGRDFGQDIIVDSDNTAGNLDAILLDAGILPEDITLRRIADDLVLSINDTLDTLTVSKWFLNDSPDNQVERIQFADGTLWDAETIKQMVLIGTSGDDVLNGYSSNDVIRGLAGNDMLYGRAGDDTIEGGSGNDSLYGEAGNDTYLFGRDFGQDIIVDSDNTAGNLDAILLDAGILPEDITLRRIADDLVLSINDTLDTLTVSKWFLNESPDNQVEHIEFADGTIWDVNTIKQIVLQGTPGDDVLIGYSSPDVISGLDGNDELYGLDGADTLDGCAGNDTLIGNKGNDVYIFGRGYGQDKAADVDSTPGNIDIVQLTPDVRPEDISLTWGPDGLYLTINGTSDSLLLSNWFVSDSRKIECIHFADGTVWDTAMIQNIAGTPTYIETQLTGTPDNDVLIGNATSDFIQGIDGNDRLYGNSGNDIIFGGDGRDALYGGYGDDILDGGYWDDYLYGGSNTDYLDSSNSNGNDTYMFGYGSGQDVIIDYDKTPGNVDTILLNADITPADVTLKRKHYDGVNDLVISLNDSDDTLTVKHWFLNNENKVEHIQFADGTVWDVPAMEQLVLQGTSYDDILVGYSTSDIIRGYNDDDELYGRGGDDLIGGGLFYDELNGDDGNDTLMGGDGVDSWNRDYDTLYGGAGDDVLDGGAGYDTLYGGSKGNWYLQSGTNGNDTYLFGSGSGNDLVYDYDEVPGNLDTILLKDGINPEDVSLSRVDDDLVLSCYGEITVGKWFLDDAYKVEQIQFADGTIWDVSYINQNVYVDEDYSHYYTPGELIGTDGDDYLYGYDVLNGGSGNDTLHGGYYATGGLYGKHNPLRVDLSDWHDTLLGGEGDDELYGGWGNDVLDGGAGNDELCGGDFFRGRYWWGSPESDLVDDDNGSDTYLFGRGSGQDTIYDWDSSLGNIDTILLGSDILPSDITLQRSDEDAGYMFCSDSLVLSIAGTTDTLKIQNWFDSNGEWQVERIQFADGTIWDLPIINQILLQGTPDNDFISGDISDDIIDGGMGNDTLYGGTGNDTYIFGRGYGQDTIIDIDVIPDNLDTINLKDDVLPSDVTLKRGQNQYLDIDGCYYIGDDQNLFLTINGTTDQLQIYDWFRDDGNKIESIQFSDGTLWDTAMIQSIVDTHTDQDDFIVGTPINDAIDGGAGNDVICGGDGGDDVIYGGDGDDILYGGSGYEYSWSWSGYDTLIGGAGSDTLNSAEGFTVMSGGPGNDYIDGVKGLNNYIFNKGDGFDDIRVRLEWGYGEGGPPMVALAMAETEETDTDTDTVFFGEGITPESIRVQVNDGSTNGLIQVAIGTGVEEGFLIDGWAVGGEGGYVADSLMMMESAEGDSVPQLTDLAVKEFVFADGRQLSLEQIIGMADGGVIGEQIGTLGNDFLLGSVAEDYIIGSSGDDWIDGRDNDDIIWGDGYAPGFTDTDDINILIGGDGSDELLGGDGDEIIAGAQGDDYLEGYYGSDVYCFNRGDGLDVIYNYPGSSSGDIDTLSFGVNIKPGDISGYVDDMYGGLVLLINGGQDSIYIDYWFDPENDFTARDGSDISCVQFISEDGSSRIFDLAGIVQSLSNDLLAATAENPISLFTEATSAFELTGSVAQMGGDHAVAYAQTGDLYGVPTYLGGNDVIDAGSGDDEVAGGDGDDIIAGAQGDDSLYGEHGNDVYCFNRGDGKDYIDPFPGVSSGEIDTISFGVNINPGDIFAYTDIYVSSGYRYGDLVLTIAGSEDSITIDWFDRYSEGKLANVQFIDENGQTRIFDLAGIVEYLSDELIATTADNPISLFTEATSAFELTGSVAQAGGDHAVAYAQTGDLFGVPTYHAGGPGDDLINGRSGDDTIEAGEGNNTINAGDGNNTVTAGSGDDVITTGKGNDVINAGGGENIVSAGDGDDLLISGPDDDVLDAGAGNDTIIGGGGLDNLIGGAGDDTYNLIGGAGDNTYNLNLLEDNWNWILIDDVADASGGNRVVFGEGIAPEDLSLSFYEYEEEGFLEIAVGEGDYGIEFRGFNPNDAYGTHAVEYYEFADGQVLTYGQLIDKGFDISGTEGDDLLIGISAPDRITAFGGNDVLSGGAGNDILDGGSGNDTYIFNLGDGIDTIIDRAFFNAGNIIEFGAGITMADLSLATEGNTLIINVGNSGDALRLEGFNPEDAFGDHTADIFRFADGTAVRYEQLITMKKFIFNGTAGDDVITGTSLDDIFQGNAGNDTIYGSSGNDVYVFNPGDGVDTIYDEAFFEQSNALVFGSGISPEDLLLSHDPANGVLIINIGNTGDAVRLANFDAADPYGPRAIEYYHFADGQVLTYNQLIDRGFDINGTSGDDNLIGTATVDRINGNAGNDTLSGGEGFDILAGGAGDDTYVFNLGDGIVVIDDVAVDSAGNALEFGVGITLADISNNLSYSSDTLIIRVGENGDEVHLTGFNPDAADTGSRAVQTFLFSDGTIIDYEELIQSTFIIHGDDENNYLAGTNVRDRLYGHGGYDTLVGGDGDDVLTGGSEDDYLIGSNGSDTYVFNIGDGVDTIDDVSTPDEGNMILFGDGITPEDISFVKNGDVLTIYYGNNGDAVNLLNFDQDEINGSLGVRTLEFADGTQMDLAYLLNRPPVVANVLPDQTTLEDEAFSFTIPGDTFADPDLGDFLICRATLADGMALPSWLTFDLMTMTFTGTPTNDDVGSISLKVTAMDNAGATVSSDFNITVENINDAPVVANAIADQNTLEDALFNFTVPVNTFADPDLGDILTYSATLADGTVLPAWLTFDPATMTFSGTPANDDVGSISLKVTATDTSGVSVTDDFTITVENINDAPVVVNPITDQHAFDDAMFNFTVPANTFADIDAGDTLTYSATLADGTALPAWLAFDPGTMTFSGTPNDSDVGTLSLKVTATDLEGASASCDFNITVENINDAPVVASAIADQNTLEDALFNFTVPVDTFADPDLGDTLTYSATLADGTALPAWLTFDPASLTFTGTPTNDDVGTLSLKVTATDLEGANVSDDFTITVENVNDAPVLVSPIADQNTLEDAQFNFTVPGNTFADVDVGDTLTYSATLSDGTALPAWLTFDPATMTFSGTPTGSDVGTLSLKVTATDTAGASISDDFDIVIEEAGGGPVVVTYGTNKSDLIITGKDNDLIYALNGNDLVYSSAGNDTVYGGNGKDIIFGGSDKDHLYGENGNDILFGDSGNDMLDGGNGTDLLYGGSGDDNLHGGNGSDILYGGDGNDILVGGTGHDVLAGGAGSDTYIFRKNDGKDTITDYGNSSEDIDTLKLVDGIEASEPVIVKQNGDLYVFVDGSNYVKIASQFSSTNYGIERLEVTDGQYITRQDIEDIVNTMSSINNDSGMDVMQKYNAMMNDQQYLNILAQSWK